MCAQCCKASIVAAGSPAFKSYIQQSTFQRLLIYVHQTKPGRMASSMQFAIQSISQLPALAITRNNLLNSKLTARRCELAAATYPHLSQHRALSKIKCVYIFLYSKPCDHKQPLVAPSAVTRTSPCQALQSLLSEMQWSPHNICLFPALLECPKSATFNEIRKLLTGAETS